ncbi:DUF1552 domain-containing protein [Paraglaciecola aquimarina]|uniref:DUF1552 domain-containing protein n=1 Tax=Paraglaciecola algarum TaxID=3050085 RepID=A0ABS9D2X0_9ALTE|nr:DUF1552 domain-containing protein [Paraglaciecola sp. G1-23]MCF2946817.1 DUF1552 domain-containing protein [Paraglaciecola sp. G1-23]
MSNKVVNFNRRTFLKSATSSLLLPALPSIATSAVNASSNGIGLAEKGQVKRLCCLFFGMGVSLPPKDHVAHKDWQWFPHEYGKDYSFSKSNIALEPFKQQLSFLSGLSHPRTRDIFAHSTGGYFLSGADPLTPAGNSISADQLHAMYAGSQTRYPYITMGSEGGLGDFRRPNTMSYAGSGQPIPSIGSPREVFNELFGVPSGDKESIRQAFGRDRSILDAILPDLKRLNHAISNDDKSKLEQYVSAVRSLETRVEKAEEWLDVPKPHVDEKQFILDVDPIQDGPTQFIDSMYQLIHTAFLTDSTRTVAYQKVKESPGGLANRFPEAIGLPNHHDMSHGFNKEGGYENWGTYDAYLTERFAGFLKQMAETADPYAEGSLLDNTIVLYGSTTSTVHNPRNYPLIVAGGRNLGLSHGAHHHFAESIPMSNLLLTLLQQLGTPVDSFSDSTGTLSHILA